MDPEARYRALLSDIQAEFPRFRLIPKEQSLLQRIIARLLAALTLGGQRAYATAYVTTIGSRVYLPAGWEGRGADDRYVTMRHERVHLRQFRRWTIPLMAIAYLLLPLPLGLAWCRYRLERAAYEETLRAAAEVWGRTVLCDAAFRGRIVDQFTSGAYGWMWPFRGAVERWYDAAVASL